MKKENNIYIKNGVKIENKTTDFPPARDTGLNFILNFLFRWPRCAKVTQMGLC